MTGTVIEFPTQAARTAPLRLSVVTDNPAPVIILPVVRIERINQIDQTGARRKFSADICGNE